MINFARKLRKLEKKHLRGVKGYSILSCFPLLNLGTCLIPEFMHSVLLGVVKRFFNIYINKPGPWSVKPFIKDIDKFITNIRPPLSFNRMPRPLTQSHFFKASEFYNLLLFYSLPALENYLSEKYFQHLMGLVIAIFNLVQDQITVEDLEQADKLLKVFVEEIPDLFSDTELTYNSHQLLHLVLSVKRWGPLSATSAFCFENYNGFIAKSVTGTKHLSQEIVNNVMIAQSIGILRNHITAVTAHNQNFLDIQIVKSYELLGKRITNIRLSDLEHELFAYEGIDLTNVFVYARAKINNKIYTSNIYKEIKANSHNIEIVTDNNVCLYGSINFFFEYQNSLYFILQIYAIEHTRIFMHLKTKTKIKHIKPIKKTGKSIIIALKNLLSISLLIKVGDYVCKKPNLFDRVW